MQHAFSIFLIVFFALAIVNVILMIDKPREKTTAESAAVATFFYGLIILVVTKLFL